MRATVYTATGINSMFPINSDGALIDVSPGTTVTLDVVAGGFIVGQGFAHSSGTPEINWSNMTEDHETTVEGNIKHSGGHVYPTSAGTLTVAAYGNNNGNTSSPYVVASFDPASTVQPVLDAYNPTGAWSMSRKLIQTYGGSYYADTGGAITTLYDQSGNARDATDGSVSTRRPAVTTGGPNSIACADFDGSSDYLTGSAMTSHVTVSEAFIVMTVIFDSITNSLDPSFSTTGHCAISDDTGRLGLFANVDSGTDKIFAANYVSGGSDTRVGVACPETDAHVITLRHSGGNLYVSIDGGSETSVASGDTNAGMGNLRFGYRGNAYFDGKLFEAATFNYALSSTDRDAIVANFMDHVGI